MLDIVEHYCISFDPILDRHLFWALLRLCNRIFEIAWWLNYAIDALHPEKLWA